MSKKTERDLMDSMKRGQDGGHEHPHVGSTESYRNGFDNIDWHHNRKKKRNKSREDQQQVAGGQGQVGSI